MSTPLRYPVSDFLHSGRWLSLLLLASLMGLTRYHHFGDSFHLPDASWAAFFLGGFLLQRWRYFLGLCALAFGIDALALEGGVSSFCVTPAYGFLIPTHAALWLAGRRADRHNLPAQLLFCAGATVIAFLISNLSFYAFSGYFSEQSLVAYVQNSFHYLGHYLLNTLGYGVVGLLVHRLFTRGASPSSLATGKSR